MSKKALLSHLSLSNDFNKNDVYNKDDFKDWRGKTLIISCEDDPGYKDTELLYENLPNTNKHIFPKGSGHLSSLINEDEYLKVINDFLKSL